MEIVYSFSDRVCHGGLEDFLMLKLLRIFSFLFFLWEE